METTTSTTTIRVSRRTRETLREITKASGHSVQEVIEQALELYRRRQLLEATNVAYATLRDTPNSWHDFEDELKAWEASLDDGLEEV